MNLGIMMKEEWNVVRRVEELKRNIEIFKIQGFKTPEEMFVVGYLMAHGGERHILKEFKHNIEFLRDFWRPIIKDQHEILSRVSNEDIETAKTLLRQLMEERKARFPKWLEI